MAEGYEHKMLAALHIVLMFQVLPVEDLGSVQTEGPGGW